MSKPNQIVYPRMCEIEPREEPIGVGAGKYRTCIVLYVATVNILLSKNMRSLQLKRDPLFLSALHPPWQLGVLPRKHITHPVNFCSAGKRRFGYPGNVVSRFLN